MERQALNVAKPLVPGSGAKRLCCLLDGTLAQARRNRDAGTPFVGALEFLMEAHKAGLEVFICDRRPANLIYEWLRIHSPIVDGTRYPLEHVVHICRERPNVDVVLDDRAIPFTHGAYPSPEELLAFTPWWAKL